MSSLLLLARAYPAIFLLPALNTFVFNGIAIRIGTNVVQKLCINLPIYVYTNMKNMVTKHRDEYDDGVNYMLIEISKDLDYPEYENIKIL